MMSELTPIVLLCLLEWLALVLHHAGGSISHGRICVPIIFAVSVAMTTVVRMVISICITILIIIGVTTVIVVIIEVISIVGVAENGENTAVF